MTSNPHACVGAGRNRRTWRIKEWMDAAGILQRDVADAAGLKGVATVSRTIRGSDNNRKVLSALLDMGCPERFLGLPEDMQTKEVA